jgi:hypothetical protein
MLPNGLEVGRAAAPKGATLSHSVSLGSLA